MFYCIRISCQNRNGQWETNALFINKSWGILLDNFWLSTPLWGGRRCKARVHCTTNSYVHRGFSGVWPLSHFPNILQQSILLASSILYIRISMSNFLAICWLGRSFLFWKGTTIHRVLCQLIPITHGLCFVINYKGDEKYPGLARIVSKM